MVKTNFTGTPPAWSSDPCHWRRGWSHFPQHVISSDLASFQAIPTSYPGLLSPAFVACGTDFPHRLAVLIFHRA